MTRKRIQYTPDDPDKFTLQSLTISSSKKILGYTSVELISICKDR